MPESLLPPNEPVRILLAALFRLILKFEVTIWPNLEPLPILKVAYFWSKFDLGGDVCVGRALAGFFSFFSSVFLYLLTLLASDEPSSESSSIASFVT